jgi:hypothetical protein
MAGQKRAAMAGPGKAEDVGARDLSDLEREEPCREGDRSKYPLQETAFTFVLARCRGPGARAEDPSCPPAEGTGGSHWAHTSVPSPARWTGRIGLFLWPAACCSTGHVPIVPGAPSLTWADACTQGQSCATAEQRPRR